MELLIGADPEFFVKKGNRNECAHGLIPGNKDNPFKVEGGAVQVDGMALEFNIDPAKEEQQFVNSIDLVLEQLRDMVPEEYKFNFNNYATFSNEVFDQAPQEAKILGCDPDYDATSGKENVTPNANKNFRTASGHIHIGWTKNKDLSSEHMFDCRSMTAYMDYYVGAPLALMEKSNKRQSLYGKPATFRPKPYGCEYRTPSNIWLKHEDLKYWVFRQTHTAFENCKNNKLSRYDWGYARNAIIYDKTLYLNKDFDFKKSLKFLNDDTYHLINKYRRKL